MAKAKKNSAKVKVDEVSEVVKNQGEVNDAESMGKVADQSGEAGAVETENKTRRQNGAGSVYPLSDGKGRHGFCIQLSADKELRKLYGNKLRHLGVGKDKADAEAKCADAISRREELLAAKLEKLGHFKVEGEGVREDTPATEEAK